MSLDYSIHIGPYLECQVAKVQVQKEKRTCVNVECKNHGKAFYSQYAPIEKIFCELCGNKIETISTPIEMDSVHTGELRDKIKEKLIPLGGNFNSKEEHYWVSNQREDSHISYDPKTPDEEKIITELVFNKMSAMMSQFEEYFEKEIKIIKKEYGEDRVKIKFGVLCNVS